MYQELDRTWIRHFVGYGAIFLQAEPRLENAINATQSALDGGARPDSNTENYILGLVYGSAGQTGSAIVPGPVSQSWADRVLPATVGLVAIEAQLSSMWGFTFASTADEAKVDTYRGMIQLRSEGRRLAHSLARMLGMRGVRADVFSPGQAVIDDNPFSYDNLQHWRGGP